MPDRPTRAELEAKLAAGEYAALVKSAMKDFCFTIDRHEGKDKVWFGKFTLTINRNVAFNFFDRDPRDDKNLEPYPVVKGERYEVLEHRVRPEEDDPSADYVVAVYFLPRHAWTAAVRSMEDILALYGGLRTLPDAWFDGEEIVTLARERLLLHPSVQAERANDWPELLR